MISESQISMDDFSILKVIGRGSYAKVLMVELKSSKQIYAMKVIKKALVMDEEVRRCVGRVNVVCGQGECGGNCMDGYGG